MAKMDRHGPKSQKMDKYNQECLHMIKNSQKQSKITKIVNVVKNG